MFDESKLSAANGSSATVSIKDWLLYDCINFLSIIPIVGTIAALVIYAIIGFGNSAAPSMKNRVLASFIWLVICIVVLIVLFAGGILSLGMFDALNSGSVTSSIS